jgi:hypothetical protein
MKFHLKKSFDLTRIRTRISHPPVDRVRQLNHHQGEFRGGFIRITYYDNNHPITLTWEDHGERELKKITDLPEIDAITFASGGSEDEWWEKSINW